MQDGRIVSTHPRGADVAIRLVSDSVNDAEFPAASALSPRHDRTDSEMKRGMFFNTIALLASNFRGVFTFLIARMLGAAVLGTFIVAWATTDVMSKIGMFGLDNTIITFIARSEARGSMRRSRALISARGLWSLLAKRDCRGACHRCRPVFGRHFGLDPEMIAALSVLLCALPGVTLYRICTADSRGMKVMRHDIFSRGIAELDQ